MSESFQQAAFKLCKDITSMPQRQQIKESIEAIMYSKDDDPKNRSMIHYYARTYVNHANQFVNYFLIHEKNDEMKPPHKFPGWDFSLTTDELHNFVLAHNTIKAINLHVVSKLYENFPKISGLLSVYGYNLADKEYNHNSLIDIEHTTLNDLLSAFQSSDPVEALYSVKREYIRLIDYRMFEALINFEIKLREENLTSSEVSREYFDLQMNLMRGDQEGEITKAFFAIIAIRSMIKNLNQLIFQSFYMDKLLTISSDAVYNFDSNNSNYLCKYGHIGYQINQAPLVNPNQIVLIVFKTEKRDFKSLVIPQGMGVNIAGDKGDVAEFDFIKLDKDMNTFCGLIR